MNLEGLLGLPLPAIRTVFGFLRYPELEALRQAIPELNELIDGEIRLEDREYLQKKRFKWNRCAPEEMEDTMAERHKHCSIYHPLENAIYCFGGEVIRLEQPSDSAEIRPASFNDFWKFNLATAKWSRVIVAGPPYPLPKCEASITLWNNEIVLFGGYRPLPAASSIDLQGSNQSEIHIYNTETNCWRTITTVNNGPELAGHSSVIIGDDRMLVYGGQSESAETNSRISTIVHVLNLKQQKWYEVTLYSGRLYHEPIEIIQQKYALEEGFRYYPEIHPKKSSLINISKSIVLLTGEMSSRNYGYSILLQFNPENPETGEWKWKAVETIGRWWIPRVNTNNHQLFEREGCSIPNYDYHQITSMRQGSNIRLISLGRPSHPSMNRYSAARENYDTLQLKSQRFLKYVRDILETEMHTRIMDRDQDIQFPTSLTLTESNIECVLQNVFLEQEQVWEAYANRRPLQHTMDRCRISVRTIDGSQGMDQVDLWELRTRLRECITKIHKGYYNSEDEYVTIPLPNRNSALKRLNVYMAEINVDEDESKVFENFGKIEWIQQPTEYRAAPETSNYTLTAARYEVVVHGGTCLYNEKMRRMGHTYILTLANSKI